MGYKYPMNPSRTRFTITSCLTFSVYIFLQSISLKYHCDFSLYKVINFTIREPSRPLKETFYRYRLVDIICYYHSYRSPQFTRHYLLPTTQAFQIKPPYKPQLKYFEILKIKPGDKEGQASFKETQIKLNKRGEIKSDKGVCSINFLKRK